MAFCKRNATPDALLEFIRPISDMKHWRCDLVEMFVINPWKSEGQNDVKDALVAIGDSFVRSVRKSSALVREG